jgi:hypothetical protein
VYFCSSVLIDRDEPIPPNPTGAVHSGALLMGKRIVEPPIGEDLLRFNSRGWEFVRFL